MEQVADATRPTHACHVRSNRNFAIKELLESTPSKVYQIQLELLHLLSKRGVAVSVIGGGRQNGSPGMAQLPNMGPSGPRWQE